MSDNKSRISRLRKQQGKSAPQKQAPQQAPQNIPKEGSERGVIPAAYEGGLRPQLEREKRFLDPAEAIGTGAWQQSVHVEQNHPKTRVPQQKQTISLPRTNFQKPVPAVSENPQIPQQKQVPFGVGYEQSVWNDKRAFAQIDENEYIATDPNLIQGQDPVSELDQQMPQVEQQIEPQAEEQVADTQPGQYLVIVDNLMEQIVSTQEQVRSIIEFLVFEKDISIKEINVYKHLELDFGVMLKD